LRIVAVEKNPNAFLSIKYRNAEEWNNSVLLLQTDMRELKDIFIQQCLTYPDIIISELLGSFGDNELSPECLDSVLDIILPHTICIPQYYRNYIVPIQSVHLYQTILTNEELLNSRNGRNCVNNCLPTDSLYVVSLKEFCMLESEPKQCFEFVHPNLSNASNERVSSLKFSIGSYPCELMGFAGYFEATLYKNISICTHPKRHSVNMHSWFPSLFPLRELYRFSKETLVIFNLSRKIDNFGVWYEWFIEYVCYPITDDL